MKKTFSKFLATAAAVSMLASVSVVANADATFETTTTDAGVIITGVTGADDLTDITVPAEIDGAAVVGIADFAFADLDNATNIYVPASVKNANIGNSAFVTKKCLMAYLEKSVGADATKDDVIAYIAETFGYDVATTEAKVMEKAALAGVTITDDMTAEDLAEAAAVILQADDATLNLSAETADELAVWEATIENTNVAVILEEGSDVVLEDGIATEPIVVVDALAGDANNDGVINVRDAAAIAAALANGAVDTLEGDGDYNADDVVNVRDAAAIAAALANGTLGK